MALKIKNLSVRELLKEYARIMTELKVRTVIRTHNNPVADYAEWLVKEKLRLKLEASSHKGHDAVGKDGTRYQIKSRRLHRLNSSRQLGVIRNLNKNDFDILISVLFDEEFKVSEAYHIPQKVIGKFAKWNKHQNGHILQLRGELLKTKGVKNITSKLK